MVAFLSTWFGLFMSLATTAFCWWLRESLYHMWCTRNGEEMLRQRFFKHGPMIDVPPNLRRAYGAVTVAFFIGVITTVCSLGELLFRYGGAR